MIGNRFTLLSVCFLVISFAATSILPAFIVAGANGGGNTSNNTTAASLNSVAPQFFPYFDNVIHYSDSTGVYLGHDTNFDIWVLSAAHVNNSNANITIDGLSYTFQQRFEAAGDGSQNDGVSGDVELLRYSRLDNAVPTLPAVKLAPADPGVSEVAFLIGRGRNRVEDAPTSSTSGNFSTQSGSEGYHWSGSFIKRWGTNNVEDVSGILAPPDSTRQYSIGGRIITGWETDFDKPQSGEWLDTNEAQGSNGDSGGGAFVLVNGEWQMVGFPSAITGSVANFAGFGNTTIFNNIATYKDEIDAITGGALIPEPGASLLILLGGAGLLLRRPRR